MDASSKFAIGDLTQIFTALTVLLEIGDKAWFTSIVDCIPELGGGNSTSSIERVRWEDVTLGALASHLAGIARDSDACHVNEDCAKDIFLQSLTTKPPVELPDSTPIFSHAAFQLLALAIEAHSHKAFSGVLLERIVRPLQLNSTAFLIANTTTFGNGLANATLDGEPASLGLTSSILDLSTLGRALLTSSLLDAAEMRRWLKPVSSSSNLRNAVGRPWEIYHYSDTAIDPIIDVYTKTGAIGHYSSYFGLVPSVDIGFTILAVDTVADAPDLNAYADIALAALVQIQELGYREANATIAGSYKGSDDAVLSLRLTGTDPGIAISNLFVNGTDWLEIIANRAGVERPQDLDLRLYPTGLEEKRAEGGKRQVFQGVIQDTSALVDAGTPTCISWQTVGEIELNGSAVDRFILSFGEGGTVDEVQWEAGGVMFRQ